MNGLLLLATLSLGHPFGDSMVLQRGVSVPVWGKADAGAVVAVSFAGNIVTGTADAEGKWKVSLPVLEASSEPRELTVTAGKETKTFADVVVGEVWLCSGQSNMEMTFAEGQTRYGDGIGAMIAQVTDKPFVRYMRAPGRKGWQRFTPESLRTGRRSALAVEYALELHDKLGVPVGVVVAAAGGSNIDTWNPGNGTNAVNHLAFVKPLGPLAMRGAIWYQGEANVREVDAYPGKLETLRRAWAEQFGNPAFPIYLVQLAPNKYAKPDVLAALPHFMEAQAKYAEGNPHAAVAVINDIGNYSDVHPNNKWLVAKRLALHAFKRDYGFKNVEDDSPFPSSATLVATNRVRITFNHANWLYVYRTDTLSTLYAGFEIAGTNGIWKKANIANFAKLDWTRYGTITNNYVDLVAKEVEQPVRVRYAYAPPFTGVLYNQVNLPCGPFTMDVPPSKDATS